MNVAVAKYDPQLERCSKGSAAILAALSGHTEKRFRDGGRRSVRPEDTLERLTPLLSNLGVTRVANITGLDRIGIPVVAVCRPNSRSLSVYQGKGASLAAAKASGLMESVERYHAEYATPPAVFASYVTMRGSAATVPMEVFPKREGAVFQPELGRGWVQGVNLFEQTPVWIPHEIVHYATAGERGADDYFQTASTGLAAGNTLSEAILHGLCEVMERDCSTLWRLRVSAMQSVRRVELDTIDDILCIRLLEQITAAELTAAIWETTTDTAVASFLCRIVEAPREGGLPYEFIDAAGCHPVREVALARAILEAVQGRATVISGARDDLFYNYYEPNDPTLAQRIRHDAERGPGIKAFGQAPTFDGDFIEEDISHVLGRLEHAGISYAIAVDLTRDDFKIPVVRVIIPEIEDGELSERYSPRERAIRAFRGTL